MTDWFTEEKMSRQPCMEEVWFVSDALETYEGLCPMCRRVMDRRLQKFGATPSDQFSQVYKFSRSIRVNHIFEGRTEAAKATDNWEVLRVIGTIQELIGLGLEVYNDQKPAFYCSD